MDTSRGISLFSIHGELFHFQGPLVPGSQEIPCFAQLFFYDPDYATTTRMARYPTLNRGLLTRLTGMLSECNHNLQLYKTARERLAGQGDTDYRLLISP